MNKACLPVFFTRRSTLRCRITASDLLTVYWPLPDMEVKWRAPLI